MSVQKKKKKRTFDLAKKKKSVIIINTSTMFKSTNEYGRISTGNILLRTSWKHDVLETFRF